MGMSVNREIVAGNTLIAEAIQSQNFVAGVSGWQIRADGAAEFSQVTVRGQVFVTGANGSYVQIRNVFSAGAEILLKGQTISNATVEAAVQPANIIGGNDNNGTLTRNYLSQWPPNFNPQAYPQLDMISGSYDGSIGSQVRFFDPSSNPLTVNFDTGSGGLVTMAGRLNVTSVVNLSNAVNVTGKLANPVDGLTYLRGQNGNLNVSVANGVNNVVVAVTFPITFPNSVPPVVVTNIEDSGGQTARWISRAYGVTTTGFNLWLLSPTSTNTTAAATPKVTWSATVYV